MPCRPARPLVRHAARSFAVATTPRSQVLHALMLLAAVLDPATLMR